MVDRSDLTWFLGFLEGEGCFNISFSHRPKRRGRVEVNPTFQVKLSDRDIETLQFIQSLLTEMGIKASIQSSGSGCSKVRAHGLRNCIKLSEYLRKLDWHTSKGRDFDIWRQILELVEKRKHLTKEGLLRIAELRNSMNLSGKKQGRYITPELLGELLEGKENYEKRLIEVKCKKCGREWIYKGYGIEVRCTNKVNGTRCNGRAVLTNQL